MDRRSLTVVCQWHQSSTLFKAACKQGFSVKGMADHSDEANIVRFLCSHGYDDFEYCIGILGSRLL